MPRHPPPHKKKQLEEQLVTVVAPGERGEREGQK